MFVQYLGTGQNHTNVPPSVPSSVHRLFLHAGFPSKIPTSDRCPAQLYRHLFHRLSVPPSALSLSLLDPAISRAVPRYRESTSTCCGPAWDVCLYPQPDDQAEEALLSHDHTTTSSVNYLRPLQSAQRFSCFSQNDSLPRPPIASVLWPDKPSISMKYVMGGGERRGDITHPCSHSHSLSKPSIWSRP